MADLIKVRVNEREQLLSAMRKDKDFKSFEWIDEITGQKTISYQSNKHNLLCKVTPQNATIENSLHKYFNIGRGAGNQNYDDFSFCNINYSLACLKEEVQIPLSDMALLKLEFGFNLQMGQNPCIILQDSILMHNYKYPCYDPKNNSEMCIKKFHYSEYEVKIYSKSLHLGNEHEFREILKGKHIIRFEIKYTSRKILNRMGIYTLQDLTKIDTYHRLMADFIKKYDDLTIIDSYDGDDKMTNAERMEITKMTHNNYWIELRKIRHANTIGNHKKKFLALIVKYGLNKQKNEIREALVKKFHELFSQDCSELLPMAKAS